MARTHLNQNPRHQGNRQGSIYRFNPARPAAQPPVLKEGQVRCECGAAVRLRKDGTLMGHKTLLHGVPCIHVGEKPA